MVMVSALAAVTVALGSPLSASASPESSSSSPSATASPSATESPDATQSSGTGGQYPTEMNQLQQEIEKLNAAMLATADAANQAVGQASVAKETAAQAKADLDAATAEAEAAKQQANDVAADMYKQGPMSLIEQTLLSSNGPQEFIDKAVFGDTVADYQVANINKMLIAQKKQAEATTAAEEAAAAAQAKADEAQKISSDSQAKLAAAQVQMDALKAQAAAQAAASAASQGAEPASATQVAAPPADASSGATGQVTGEWALPTSGTFTSGFGGRWGTFHQGIDIAGPIGTPIFSAGAGTVLRAGPATGFGLAVYIQHPSGEVTVYGHINAYYVSAGQQVTAGQRIADIGNRGYSTGPHLHFEVQQGAYGSRVNPQAWLAARGIAVG